MRKPILSFFFIFILLLTLAYPVASWRKETKHPVLSFSACTNYLYLGFTDGVVSAFQASDGTELWSLTLPNSQVPSALACDDATVYAGTKSGSIFQLGSSTGLVKNSLALSGNSSPGFVTSLTVVPPYVFASSYGAYMINSQANTVRWAYPTKQISSPLGFSPNYAFFESNSSLYSLDANTGNLVWTAPISPTFLSAPYYSQNSVYMGSTSNSLHAFDSSKGIELWGFETSGWVSSTPISYLNMIVFGSNDHNIYAVSPEGSQTWKFKTGEAVQSKLQIISGKGSGKFLAFASNDGYFYLLDPLTGTLILRAQTGGPSRFFTPVEGGIFVASDNGIIGVYSLDSGCNFDSPAQGEYVNLARVHVLGSAFSKDGVSEVQVRINDGEWESAKGKSKWEYAFDPGDIITGPFTIECRILDNNGKTEAGVYSSQSLVKSPLASEGTIRAKFSPWYATQPQTINLIVTDSAGDPLVGALVTFEGKTYTTDSGPLVLTPLSRGELKAVITKDGYKESNMIFYNIISDNSSVFLFAIVVLIALLIAYFAFFRKGGSAPANPK